MNSTVFVKFQWGDPLSSSLSRHAILHGGDTDYATALNSVKALLLFDFVLFGLYAMKLDAGT